MRDVSSGWLMTWLAPSPVMVALVQAAGTLPAFVLALPAGALADLLDRRWLLIGMQAFLGVVALALAVLTALGLMTPWLLLALVLAGGIGAALAAPAWQSSVPEMVPRADLRAAVALNSMGVNVSRAIGPALGGLIVATLGVAAAYLADALSYLVVIGALLWWRRAAPASEGPPETLPGAMQAGLRYALHATALRRVLLRAAVFFAFGAAHWALLPLLARQTLGGGPGLYGLMLAGIGVGAVGGAVALPWLRKHLGGPEGLMLAGALGGAAAQAGLGTRGLGGGRGRALRPGWRRLDRGAHHAERHRPGGAAQLGPGARARALPHRLLRRHGARRRGLGTDCGVARHPRRAVGRRRGRRGGGPAGAGPAAAVGRGGARPFAPLAGPAGHDPR